MFLKILLLYIAVVAQSTADDVVLTEITNRLIKTLITQGSFQQQKRLKVLRKPLISTGTFIYHQSKGVIWRTITPIPSLLLLNETRLLTTTGEQILPATFGKVFKGLLGADLSALTDSFVVSGIDRKTAWQLVLTPKDELLKKIINTIILTGNTELSSIEIHETSGNSTYIRFEKITHPARLTDKQEADFAKLSP
jgi:outer membrane lipoprotein-sorting protein